MVRISPNGGYGGRWIDEGTGTRKAQEVGRDDGNGNMAKGRIKHRRSLSEITRTRSGSDAGASSQGSPAAKGLDIQDTKAPRNQAPSAKLSRPLASYTVSLVLAFKG